MGVTSDDQAVGSILVGSRGSEVSGIVPGAIVCDVDSEYSCPSVHRQGPKSDYKWAFGLRYGQVGVLISAFGTLRYSPPSFGNFGM